MAAGTFVGGDILRFTIGRGLIRGPNVTLAAGASLANYNADLIGSGKHQLIPAYQPITDGSYQSARRKNSTPTPGKPAVAAAVRAPMKPGRMLTQHTGLPPRVTGSAKPPGKAARKPR